MKTVEIIKNLTDRQIEITFIVLGIFFSQNDKLNKPSKGFGNLNKQGLDVLKEEGVKLPNEFTAGQIKDLFKIEMIKRGIE